MVPMSMLAPQNGLNITAISYRGSIDFGFTVDPELIEDPWQLAEGIPIALEELKERAARVRERARPLRNRAAPERSGAAADRTTEGWTRP